MPPWKRYIALCLTVAFFMGVFSAGAARRRAQAQIGTHPPSCTAASLPANTCVRSRFGATAVVIDGASATDCTVGGGGTTVYCEHNGSAWVYRDMGSDAINSGAGGAHYAEMLSNADVDVIAVDTANQWEKITTFDSNGQANGITPDAGGDNDLTIARDGVYEVTFDVCFTLVGQAADAVMNVAIAVDQAGTSCASPCATIDNEVLTRSINTPGTDIGCGSMHGYKDLNAGQVLTLWVRPDISDVGGMDFSPQEVSFRAQEIR